MGLCSAQSRQPTPDGLPLRWSRGFVASTQRVFARQERGGDPGPFARNAKIVASGEAVLWREQSAGGSLRASASDTGATRQSRNGGPWFQASGRGAGAERRQEKVAGEDLPVSSDRNSRRQRK